MSRLLLRFAYWQPKSWAGLWLLYWPRKVAIKLYDQLKGVNTCA